MIGYMLEKVQKFPRIAVSILLAVLLGVPFCIYFFRLRYTSARDLLIDCAAAVSLYLTTLLLL